MEREELLSHIDTESTSSVEYKTAVKEDIESSQTYRGIPKRPWQKICKMFGIPLITLLIGLMAGVFGSSALTSVKYRSYTTSWSPATPHISFKLEKHQKPKSPEKDPHLLYNGPPSPDQEQAWFDLLYPVTIPMSRNELELAGEDPSIKIELEDRETYLGSLGVYHELHCLRKIRRYIYRDFWYANSTSVALDYELNHVDHCLHTLHTSAMCYGNAGLITFQWEKGNWKPRSTKNSQRMCMDWEKFYEWSLTRAGGPDPPLYRPPGA